MHPDNAEDGHKGFEEPGVCGLGGSRGLYVRRSVSSRGIRIGGVLIIDEVAVKVRCRVG